MLVIKDHGFHAVRVARVVAETAEASSLVLEAPFAYAAGQFCTFRVHVDGEVLLRCYSMSSAPGVDQEFQVTVKRVPGGVVSNWLLDHVAAGDEVEVTMPAGVFCLQPGGRDVVAFAAGSGITPVHSLLKAALASPGRRVRLLYANRDREATIFAGELDHLAGAHRDRLAVVHHLDVEGGFVDASVVEGFLAGGGDLADADLYVCGPTPFMDVIELALLAAGVAPDRIHIERFGTPVPAQPAEPAPEGAAVPRITIELAGRVASTDHHPGTTILQTARQLGLNPPFSCESGSCATCMAQLTDGACSMFVNDALTDDEVAEGWILTCQSVPTTSTVHVVYEGP